MKYEKVEIRTTHITPAHPLFGSLNMHRMPTYRFESRGDPPVRQATWEWTLLTDFWSCVEGIRQNKRYHTIEGFAYFVHENFGDLTLMGKPTDAPGVPKTYNFMRVRPNDLTVVDAYFDREDYLPEMNGQPEGLLVPGPWAKTVRDLIQDGIFIVNKDRCDDLPVDPDALYGHSQDGDLHMEITWSRTNRWVWQIHRPHKQNVTVPPYIEP